MLLSRSLQSFFAKLAQKVPVIYPILLIILVPGTLILNTLWNLSQFDRDMNFMVREQSLQVQYTIQSLQDTLGVESDAFREAIVGLQEHMPQLVSIAVYEVESAGNIPLMQTNELLATDEAVTFLSKLALAQNGSVFTDHYSPQLQKNVWILVSPIELSDSKQGLLSIQMSAEKVSSLIGRTTSDALIILGISVLVVVLLLLNHLKFFERSLLVRKLQEVDQMKNDFISVASHELKTPLVAIKGHLELLQKNAAAQTAEDVGRRVEIIRQSTKRLEGLLEDILNVSRIEQDRLDFSLSPVEITTMVGEIVEQFRLVAEEKNITISVEGEANQIFAIAHAERLHEVLTNLVSNAVKYTKQGTIVVSIAQDAEKVKIIVKDSGIGIAPEDKSKLFKKFSRISTPENQGVSGTGLGLWITFSLVEKMKGKVFVDSIQGEGTAFTVVLPRAATK